MGLLSSLPGNASEIELPKVQQERSPVPVPGEVIGTGFKKDADVVGLQQYLAFCVFGGSIKG